MKLVLDLLLGRAQLLELVLDALLLSILADGVARGGADAHDGARCEKSESDRHEGREGHPGADHREAGRETFRPARRVLLDDNVFLVLLQHHGDVSVALLQRRQLSGDEARG